MNILINKGKSGSIPNVKTSVLFFTEEDTQKEKVSDYENILKPLFKEKNFQRKGGRKLLSSS